MTGRLDDATGLAQLTNKARSIAAAMQARGDEVVSSFEALRKQLPRIEARIEGQTVSGATKRAVGIDPARVRTILEKGTVQALTAPEAKWVVREFAQFDPTNLKRLLADRPFLWRRFAEGLLRRWEDYGSNRPAWMQLAASIPSSLYPLRCDISMMTLASSSGPAALADGTRAKTARECYAAFRQWGMRRNWSLMGHAMAQVVARLRTRTNPSSLITELLEDEELRRLLPYPEQPGASAGFSVVAQASVVASLLNASLSQSSYAQTDAFVRFESSLLRGSFGDPRGVQLSPGWELVKEREPTAYTAFLQSLVREDLEFFFEKAMTNRERRAFWESYIPQVHRSLCVLALLKKEQLERRLSTADAKARSPLERVYVANNRRQEMVSAFCLQFATVTAVEFSDTGHACYFFKNEVFAKEWMPRIVRNEIKTFDAETLRQTSITKRTHHKGNWQEDFQQTLESCGVRRPVRVPRR